MFQRINGRLQGQSGAVRFGRRAPLPGPLKWACQGAQHNNQQLELAHQSFTALHRRVDRMFGILERVADNTRQLAEIMSRRL
jgi:hypothetical protein